jgi:hypothetical protein
MPIAGVGSARGGCSGTGAQTDSIDVDFDNDNHIKMDNQTSALGNDLSVLKADMAVIKTDMAVIKTDVAAIKSDLAVILSNYATRADLAKLEATMIRWFVGTAATLTGIAFAAGRLID